MNKKRLESKMKLFGDTQASLADALKISTSRLSAKINQWNGADFRQKEIRIIKERYQLTGSEIDDIFFEFKVS